VETPSFFWTAVRYNVPVYTPAWVADLLNNDSSDSSDQYLLKPFEGLVICGSYLKADQKRELEKLVEQNGGTFLQQFIASEKVDVILADYKQPDSKMALGQALMFASRLVQFDWISKSVEAKKPLFFTRIAIRRVSRAQQSQDSQSFFISCFDGMFDGDPQSSMMEIPGTNFEQQDNVDLVLQSEILEPPQPEILDHNNEAMRVNDEASAMINDSENIGLSENTSEVDSHHEERNMDSTARLDPKKIKK
jgi:hypothetical protein